jgi:hypothetical protein
VAVQHADGAWVKCSRRRLQVLDGVTCFPGDHEGGILGQQAIRTVGVFGDYLTPVYVNPDLSVRFETSTTGRAPECNSEGATHRSRLDRHQIAYGVTAK